MILTIALILMVVVGVLFTRIIKNDIELAKQHDIRLRRIDRQLIQAHIAKRRFEREAECWNEALRCVNTKRGI